MMKPPKETKQRGKPTHIKQPKDPQKRGRPKLETPLKNENRGRQSKPNSEPFERGTKRHAAYLS